MPTKTENATVLRKWQNFENRKNGDAGIAQNLALATGDSPLTIWALRPTPELGISGRPMVAILKDVRAVEFPRKVGKSRE